MFFGIIDEKQLKGVEESSTSKTTSHLSVIPNRLKKSHIRYNSQTFFAKQNKELFRKQLFIEIQPKLSK